MLKLPNEILNKITEFIINNNIIRSEIEYNFKMVCSDFYEIYWYNTCFEKRETLLDYFFDDVYNTIDHKNKSVLLFNYKRLIQEDYVLLFEKSGWFGSKLFFKVSCENINLENLTLCNLCHFAFDEFLSYKHLERAKKYLNNNMDYDIKKFIEFVEGNKKDCHWTYCEKNNISFRRKNLNFYIKEIDNFCKILCNDFYIKIEKNDIIFSYHNEKNKYCSHKYSLGKIKYDSNDKEITKIINIDNVLSEEMIKVGIDSIETIEKIKNSQKKELRNNLKITLTIDQLKNICKKTKIKCGGNKQTLSKRIVKYFNF